MALKAPYGSTRGGARRGPERGAFHPVVAVTLFACGGLLALSQIEPAAVAPVRSVLARVLTPVASVAAEAGGVVLIPLRLLISWAGGSAPSAEQSAEQAERVALQTRITALERENKDLKALTGFAQRSKAGLISARVVMRSSSPLSHTIVVDAGSAQGIGEGQPVMAGPGLIGRVVAAYEDQSSVMLLTDRLSRVPVQVGAGEVRAVLVGSGDTGARLEFVSPGAALSEGDVVTTSGLGGIFPRGLQIGVVAKAGDMPDVRLTAGDDDPLVVGVLPLNGPAYEAVTTVSTRAQKTVGQAPDVRDRPSVKASKRASERRDD